MTLQELSESYAYSAELLSRRLAQLRQEEREARDEGGAAAAISCPAAQNTDSWRCAAGCGSHFRCCECARCRAGVSCDAPAAHLLRGTRLEGVQHFL